MTAWTPLLLALSLFLGSSPVDGWSAPTARQRGYATYWAGGVTVAAIRSTVLHGGDATVADYLIVSHAGREIIIPIGP